MQFELIRSGLATGILVARRDANAPSSPAWEGALKAGMDPGEVVLGKPDVR